MTRTRSRSARALAGALSLALAVTGLSVIAASPAVAAPAVVYDSIPVEQPASYPSLGFQAQATHEFGDYVLLGGGNRVITDVTISLTSWACETGQWNLGDCVTTPGSTFTHPVTMNLYEANNTGSAPVVGDLIASVTQDVVAPFRPTPDSGEKCAQSAGSKPWYDAVRDSCQNGIAFDVSFDFSGEGAVVGNDVIVTLAYNTQSYGPAPTGNASGPENSLNVSLNNLSAPTVGTDENAGEMIRDTTFSGSTRGLKASTLISIYNGLVMEITADSVPPIDPLTDVTVYERDLGDYSASLTLAEYLEWHEGNPLAGADGSVVRQDGLNLGLVSASTVIKGIDASQPSAVVSRAQLRELIERASVVVESGSVTYQVPIFFGSPSSPTFTTLRSTSLTAGTHSFSQADTWATTRAFGPYGAQQTAPLGELIDAVFDAAAAAGGGVALAGFGVQADAPAVVAQVVWDGTRYTFTQPVIEACVPTSTTTVTNLELGGWSFTQTRAQGINEFVEGGLRVETFPDDDNLDGTTADQRKAAGYVPIDIALSEVGTVGIEFSSFEGTRPSLQLGFDADGDGTRDAYLVGEPWAYPNAGWSMTTDGDWADALFWVTGGNGFGVAPGSGYAGLGTLDDWLLANPEARIVEYGYSLGSGVNGEAVITSITVGCEQTLFDFELETLAPPTGERLFGADRYATAVEISKNSFPDGTTAVFIATGTVFADALSAAPAASSNDAPILLVRPTVLPPTVATEIQRLDPERIFILGSVGAVSQSVENAINALGTGAVIERLEGSDRYGTSRAIVERFYDDADRLFIATGRDFPDALAAGPAAAQVGGPVLLVPGTASALDPTTATLLDSLNPQTVYIAGGPTVVSDGILNQVDQIASVGAERLSGANRYETAVAINNEVFTTSEFAYIATGLGFADALGGAAAAASKSAPLYLSGPSCVPTTVLASITALSGQTVYVLGSEPVLGARVLNLEPCA